MLPVPTQDLELDPPGSSKWTTFRDLALSTLIVCAIVLIVGFLTAASAHAQPGKGELRIGYQKSAGLLVLQKAQGTLEKKLAPLGWRG